jgi:hypothetical protein
MKKTERIVLGKGFLRIINIRTRDWYEVQIPMKKLRKLWCYCPAICICKPWKVIVER